MRRLMPAVAVLSIIACGGFDGLTDPEACNSYLKTIEVLVTDAQGVPLEGLSSRTVLLRTRSPVVFDPRSVAPFGGMYPVISDLEQDILRSEGDSLGFVAWDENWAAAATFFVVPDQEGNCHLVKREGPHTLVAF